MKLLFLSGRVLSGRALRSNLFFFKKKDLLRQFAFARVHFNRSRGLAATILLFALTAASAQQTDSTKTKAVVLDEVMVSAVRATSQTPVTFSNISKKQIESRNLGQDIPLLLNYLPSVVTTSDAGNGFGYTGIRVRGSDATRVNVTINGIPYNDSESSGTYFVDLPDFASSLENIQLQRGVGTSTNGAGAFGASLNLLTERPSDSARAEIANSVGSFNSRKHTVKFSTGMLGSAFEVAGRLSVLHSDGYIDRAESDLKSYFLQGTYQKDKTTIKALAFGGKERTYQAWNGIDAAMLESDPTFNYSGMYTDEFGNTRFYKNEVDNYAQDNYQLHWNQQFAGNWSTNFALHYTKGKGYYENYKEDASLDEYGMTPVETGGEPITTSDLVRRKWLDNDFYGMTFSADYAGDNLGIIIGGALNNYEGKHYGEVVWSRFASTSEPGDHYYDQNARKTDGNLFAKANYKINRNWAIYGDLQVRSVSYETTVDSGKKVNDDFTFFNPKAGLTFTINSANNLYLSYARASKEPTRTDYENGDPRPEKLDDFELGWRHVSRNFRLNANLFAMRYKDQLVKTGALDDVGNEINANVDSSYRGGIEIDASLQLGKFTFAPNLALSTNKIRDYKLETADGLVDLGTTNISFSPEMVGGVAGVYSVTNNFRIALLSKYVGEQYAGNIDSDITKLTDYSVTDFNLNYETKEFSIFKSVVFSILINNIFDRQYVSNAYLYGPDYMSYFPQAGINFLVGVTLKL
ncbi:MAG: TonB-dependent receptor [Flavobacterium sp.]|nr:MAG: TonB-dependent receptor [Flavobacterium sp.]